MKPVCLLMAAVRVRTEVTVELSFTTRDSLKYIAFKLSILNVPSQCKPASTSFLLRLALWICLIASLWKRITINSYRKWHLAVRRYLIHSTNVSLQALLPRINSILKNLPSINSKISFIQQLIYLWYKILFI